MDLFPLTPKGVKTSPPAGGKASQGLDSSAFPDIFKQSFTAEANIKAPVKSAHVPTRNELDRSAKTTQPSDKKDHAASLNTESSSHNTQETPSPRISLDSAPTEEISFEDILYAARAVYHQEGTIEDYKLFTKIYIGSELSGEELEKLAQAVTDYRSGKITLDQLQKTLPEGITLGQVRKMMAFLTRLSTQSAEAIQSDPEITEYLKKELKNVISIAEVKEQVKPLTKADNSGVEKTAAEALLEADLQKEMASLNAVSDTNKSSVITQQGLDEFQKIAPALPQSEEFAKFDAARKLDPLNKVLKENTLTARVESISAKPVVEADALTQNKMNLQNMLAAQEEKPTLQNIKVGIDKAELPVAKTPQVEEFNLVQFAPTPLHHAQINSQISSQTPQPLMTLPAAEQVSIQITKAVNTGSDKIKINLHPADLGKVEVEMTLTRDAVKAVVHVDKPETLALLQRDAATLHRALNDAGLKTDSNSLQFNLQQDQAGHRQPQHQSSQIQYDMSKSVGTKSASPVESDLIILNGDVISYPTDNNRIDIRI